MGTEYRVAKYRARGQGMLYVSGISHLSDEEADYNTAAPLFKWDFKKRGQMPAALARFLAVLLASVTASNSQLPWMAWVKRPKGLVRYLDVRRRE